MAVEEEEEGIEVVFGADVVEEVDVRASQNQITCVFYVSVHERFFCPFILILNMF